MKTELKKCTATSFPCVFSFERERAKDRLVSPKKKERIGEKKALLFFSFVRILLRVFPSRFPPFNCSIFHRSFPSPRTVKLLPFLLHLPSFSPLFLYLILAAAVFLKGFFVTFLFFIISLPLTIFLRFASFFFPPCCLHYTKKEKNTAENNSNNNLFLNVKEKERKKRSHEKKKNYISLWGWLLLLSLLLSFVFIFLGHFPCIIKILFLFLHFFAPFLFVADISAPHAGAV